MGGMGCLDVTKTLRHLPLRMNGSFAVYGVRGVNERIPSRIFFDDATGIDAGGLVCIRLLMRLMAVLQVWIDL